MNAPVKVKNTLYAEYEELLIRRDVVKKQAFEYQLAYLREFGDLINRAFEAKIGCIRKKKIIAYCQSRINRGLPLNGAEIDRYIDSVMADYYNELQKMLERSNALKKDEKISELTYRKIRTLYRQLAKMVHPDMHPELAGDPVISDFWNRIVTAYNCNKLEELEELKVLVTAYLEKEGMADDAVIPDVGEKIIRLKEEIRQITHTDPYQYRYLLADTEACESIKKDLQDEIAEYERYAEELDTVISSFDIRRFS